LRDSRLVNVTTGLDAGPDIQEVFFHMPLCGCTLCVLLPMLVYYFT
jgi:hypothetical protein